MHSHCVRERDGLRGVPARAISLYDWAGLEGRWSLAEGQVLECAMLHMLEATVVCNNEGL